LDKIEGSFDIKLASISDPWYANQYLCVLIAFFVVGMVGFKVFVWILCMV